MLHLHTGYARVASSSMRRRCQAIFLEARSWAAIQYAPAAQATGLAAHPYRCDRVYLLFITPQLDKAASADAQRIAPFGFSRDHLTNVMHRVDNLCRVAAAVLRTARCSDSPAPSLAGESRLLRHPRPEPPAILRAAMTGSTRTHSGLRGNKESTLSAYTLDARVRLFGENGSCMASRLLSPRLYGEPGDPKLLQELQVHRSK